MGGYSGVDRKHPDNMNRKEHLAMISALPEADAMRWWLNHCPRISKKSYQEARGKNGEYYK